MASIYDNETYMQSLAASQGDVQRSVMNAVSEVAKQRAANQAAAGKIKGIGAIYDKGLAGLANADAATREAFAGMTGTYDQVGQLLHKGFDQQGIERNAQIRGIGTSLSTDITQKGNEYVSNRTREDAARVAAEREAALNRSVQLEIARRQDATARAAIAASGQVGGAVQQGPSPYTNMSDKSAQSFFSNLPPATQYMLGGAVKLAKTNPTAAMNLFNSLDPQSRQVLQGVLGEAILRPQYARNFMDADSRRQYDADQWQTGW